MNDDQTTAEGYICHVCGKTLSRQQRLTSHLLSCHHITSVTEKKSYKRYLSDDSIPIPRATKYYKSKKKGSESLSGPEYSIFSAESDEFPKTTPGTSAEENLRVNQNSDIPDEPVGTSISYDDSVIENEDEFTQKETSLTEELEFHNELSDLESVTSSICSTSDEVSSNSSSDLSDSDSLEYLSDSDNSNSDTEDNCPKISDHDQRCMALLSYIMRHRLSGKASADLLEILKILNADGSQEISLGKLKQTVQACEPVIYDICEKCSTLFPSDDAVFQCVQEGCTGLRFKRPLNKQFLRNRKCYFACLPLEQQIKDILERDGILNSMRQYKMSCKKDDAITDILNGELYKSLSENGKFLNNQNNFSLIFNTDGVPLYNSSSINIWPVYLIINELPPVARFSKKNMIVWGVWQGKGKPIFTSFFKPFIENMINIKNEGILVKVSGEEICCRGILLAGTMDLQAKALVVEMTQHNGHYGCLTCKHPGEVVNQGKGHARVYSFSENGHEQRTNQGLLQCGIDSTNSTTSKPVTGIKGLSSLFGMAWFDIVKCLGPDYMHGTLLGVTKQMMKLVLTASNAKHRYFIGHNIKQIDRRLKKMQPSDNIKRLPRKMEHNLHRYKASELQLWLLYFSLPCLTGFMKQQYLDHFALFVEGIYILLRDKIDSEMIERAQTVLVEFYRKFGQLYGKNNCTLNLHNVGCHLVEYVKYLGPLWAWSCFPFEDMNGTVVDMVHGTGDVCLQILWSVQAQKKIHLDVEYMSNFRLKNYVKKMISVQREVKKSRQAVNCYIAGGLTKFVPSNSILDLLRTYLDKEPGSDVGCISKALRVISLNGDTVFYSKEYTRMEKRIGYIVLASPETDLSIVSVQFFLYHHESKKCFAVVKMVDVDDDNPLVHPLVNHLIRVKKDQASDPTVIPVDKLKEKLILLKGNKDFECVTRLPNLYGLCS